MQVAETDKFASFASKRYVFIKKPNLILIIHQLLLNNNAYFFLFICIHFILHIFVSYLNSQTPWTKDELNEFFLIKKVIEKLSMDISALKTMAFMKTISGTA